MVGSLFSKRPRVTGSNCKISCFACTFFSDDGFSSFVGGFVCGVIKRGLGLLSTGAVNGVAVSTGAGSSIGIASAGWEPSTEIGSDSMPVFSEPPWDCPQTGGITGALLCSIDLLRNRILIRRERTDDCDAQAVSHSSVHGRAEQNLRLLVDVTTKLLHQDFYFG